MSARTSMLALAAAAGVCAAAQAAPAREGRDLYDAAPRATAARTAADAIASWPATSKDLAQAIMQEYGAPDGVAADQLAWLERRPWKRVVVFRDPETPAMPNLLLQSVAYQVPVGRWRALSAFDRGVTYDAVRGELVSRTDAEETNFLALNVADEIVRGRRTGVDGNAFYDKTLSLSFAGKSSRYMRGLLFTPER